MSSVDIFGRHYTLIELRRLCWHIPQIYDAEVRKLDPFIVSKSTFRTSRVQIHTLLTMRAGDPALATWHSV
jgi:hypothetical protein